MSREEIIFNHFTRQLEEKRIKKSDGIEVQVDAEKYNHTKAQVEEMLTFYLKNKGVCSNILLHQLTRHSMQIGEIFSEALEYYRTADILRIMEAIELKEVEGEQFRRPILRSLYKIHHSPVSGVGFSLMLNIRKYWFTKEGRIKPDKRKNYDDIIAKVVDGNVVHIANYMHMQAVHSKLTGEWLIYAKHDGRNYFLCLATHNEGDQNIFDNKIYGCYQEFPEIAIQY